MKCASRRLAPTAKKKKDLPSPAAALSFCHTCNQAGRGPVLPSPHLFWVSLTHPLSLPSPSPPRFLASFSTERGQLENIPDSFSAQTRHSPGPLIKHKPSLSPSFTLSLSLSALSPLSICLLPPLPHTCFFFSRNLFPSIQACFPPSHCPHPFALFAYLSRWRFDIHIGTLFRVNLYKAPDLLFSFRRC